MQMLHPRARTCTRKPRAPKSKYSPQCTLGGERRELGRPLWLSPVRLGCQLEGTLLAGSHSHGHTRDPLLCRHTHAPARPTLLLPPRPQFPLPGGLCPGPQLGIRHTHTHTHACSRAHTHAFAHTRAHTNTPPCTNTGARPSTPIAFASSPLNPAAPSAPAAPARGCGCACAPTDLCRPRPRGPRRPWGWPPA